MKKITLFLALFLNNNCNAQDTTNPVVFAEMIIGYSNGSSKGLTGGANLNYQIKNNLFTYRFIEVSETRSEGNVFGLPILVNVEIVKENALLVGKRIIDGNTSYSYSAGIAVVNRKFLIDSSSDVLKYNNTENIGFPFEFNIKWFNSTKQPYRIYEIIPVGKPTSFANSIGFKFYGNISKTSFVGIGLTIGLGWHKIY